MPNMILTLVYILWNISLNNWRIFVDFFCILLRACPMLGCRVCHTGSANDVTHPGTTTEHSWSWCYIVNSTRISWLFMKFGDVLKKFCDLYPNSAAFHKFCWKSGYSIRSQRILLKITKIRIKMIKHWQKSPNFVKSHEILLKITISCQKSWILV